MIQKAWKKNIAILLVVAMMLTIMPVAVFAEGGEIGSSSFGASLSAMEDTETQYLFHVRADITTGSELISTPSLLQIKWVIDGDDSAELTTTGIQHDVEHGAFSAEKDITVSKAETSVKAVFDYDGTQFFTEPITLNADINVAELKDGVNVIKEGAVGVTYNIDEGKAVAITGKDSLEPIVFENCIFNITGKTMSINGSGVGYTGETQTRLGIGENVIFEKCIFNVSDGGTCGSSGNDACIEFFGPGIIINGGSVSGIGWQGQFMGLYGSANVTFNEAKISTEGNIGGWSYAMYGSSVLNLNGSIMTATGMKKAEGGRNINVFYSGDLSTGYDAVNISDSTIDFSDNQGGGFAINNINIHVKNGSDITVNNNAGNACNSGYWIVEDSSITMNGNKGGHGLSCIGIEMTDSNLEILHNGYAGMYIQSKDSKFDGGKINIHCNGEKMLSYSAGDVWLNGHKVTFTDCESVWLGAVGRKGTVENNNCSYFVAYDLYENKTKGNTAPILENVKLDEQDTLLLNPNKTSFDYARGDTEGKEGNSNDDDLFKDATVESATGKDTAKIGVLTTAQLSHHIYDWNAGEVKYQADETHFGVLAYPCVDVCKNYSGNITDHEYSFECAGTYVYAPLVGLAFDANAGEDQVTGMPENQTEITYAGSAEEPKTNPERVSSADEYVYQFTGWYLDKDCTQPYDFSTGLEANWTVVYAGWEKVYVGAIEGNIFEDIAVNGSRNDTYDANSDKLIGDVTVQLFQENGTEPYATTASATGYYKFNKLPVGEKFFVQVKQPSLTTEENKYTAGCALAYTDENLNGNRFAVVGNTTTYRTEPIEIRTAGSVAIANAGFYIATSTTPGGGGGGGSTTYTDRTVTKLWKNDDAANRPSSITINVLNNGEVSSQITLSEANDWTYSWKTSSGNWDVEEVNVPAGYISSVSRSGNDFTITNTYTGIVPEEPITDPEVPTTEPTTPEEPITDPDVPTTDVPGTPVEPIAEPEVPLGDAPKTGDSSNAVPFAALALAAGAGLVIVRRKFN